VPRDKAIVVRSGEGRELSLGASNLLFKADDAETDGHYAISLATARENDPGTTAHVHREHDDISFVVEGTLAFETDEAFEASAGSFALIPRGVRHRWWNPRDEPATFVNIHVPGYGFERFVRDLVALSAGGRATAAAMAEFGARHDVHFDEEALRSRYAE
jgi:mannose-6-phosphate isomerase-like protein (cupin superfamily)